VLHKYDVIGVFVFIAAAMVGVFLIVGIWGPKTNGMRLEEIAR
jgi:NADH:ubiquinone oxidoreductase subunit 4 (subunit M)